MTQRYTQFWFFRKGSRNSFSTTFCVWFFNKNVSHFIFYWLTKFHCLIAFTSWDIQQYAYCNCLLTRLWSYFEFGNQQYLSNQAVFIHDQNVTTKTWVTWERKELLKWNKMHFSIAKNCLRLESMPLSLLLYLMKILLQC